jgi:hypothetical protein
MGLLRGYNSFVGFDRVKNVAVVVLANSDCDVLDIRRINMQTINQVFLDKK